MYGCNENKNIQKSKIHFNFWYSWILHSSLVLNVDFETALKNSRNVLFD